jgi:flavin reductase (DIM6/NTAB) family NADH-FMN oxidoreductase RutF
MNRTAHTTFDPDDLDGVDRYKLMTGLVVPRPIGWIGTRNPTGGNNLAPYSFFNAVAGTPPTVLFSAGRREGRPKDTLAHVMATQAFTVNIVTEDLAEAMNLSSGEYADDVDEFVLSDLTAVASDVVDAPYVAEAAAVLECELLQTVDLGDRPINTVVFGTVRRIHVRPEFLDGTRIDHERIRIVGRMAGGSYTRTADGLFYLERP